MSDTQVFRIWIRSTPQQVWDAITDAHFNDRYGYGTTAEYDLRPGGKYLAPSTAEMIGFGAPPVMCEGEVLESDPPHRLVQTWHALFNPETTAEPAQRLTWELHEEKPGVTTLTLTHELADAPATAVFISGEISGDGGGGWPMILSDLKSFLELGSSILVP